MIFIRCSNWLTDGEIPGMSDHSAPENRTVGKPYSPVARPRDIPILGQTFLGIWGRSTPSLNLFISHSTITTFGCLLEFTSQYVDEIYHLGWKNLRTAASWMCGAGNPPKGGAQHDIRLWTTCVQIFNKTSTCRAGVSPSSSIPIQHRWFLSPNSVG